MKKLAIVLTLILVGCASVKPVAFYMDGGSKADGYVNVRSEIYNYFTTKVDPNSKEAVEAATKACSKWGFSGTPEIVRDKYQEIDIPMKGMQLVQSYQCSEK